MITEHERILEIKTLPQVSKSFSEKGIRLSFDRSVYDFVIDKGYHPDLGARNLEKTFEKLILTEISNHL